jgi:hypothetical protein
MHAMKRLFGSALILSGALSGAACSPATVVNTDDAAPPPTSPAAPTSSDARPSNVHLANAFHYAAQVNGTTGYYFTTPSGRWQCAILPRQRAGCQNAAGSGSGISITGAPDEVPDADGESSPPNAIVVDQTDDPQFASVPSPGFGLDSGDATVLPLNRVLAAAGFRCNVQEVSGISCMSEPSGKGFTFSAEGFSTRYTDVPAGAP